MSTENKLTAFKPVVGGNPRLLILGSMPGVASLDANRYYAHPRNAFWPIMASLFETPLDSYAQKTDLLISHGVALWDVLKHCEREGSLDSNIQSGSEVSNDFSTFFRQWPSIGTVVFNGKAAEKLFRKQVLSNNQALQSLTLMAMPSTSPAMASLSLGEKTQMWARILEGL